MASPPPRKLDDASPPPRGRPWGDVALGVAASIGVTLFLVQPDLRDDRGQWVRPQYIVAVALAAVALIPAIGRPLSRGLDRLRRPSPKVKWLIAGVLFVVAVRYLIFNATYSERELFPKIHDEFTHL